MTPSGEFRVTHRHHMLPQRACHPGSGLAGSPLSARGGFCLELLLEPKHPEIDHVRDIDEVVRRRKAAITEWVKHRHCFTAGWTAGTARGCRVWKPRSLRLNFEFNLECYDQELTGRLEALVWSNRRRETAMYRTLLVPLDGSRFAEQALALAWSIARRAGARLQLVRVHTPQIYVEGMALLADTLDQRDREQELAYLQGVEQRIAALGSVAVGSALLDGAVADAVQEHAASCGADLVVMTTHGRGPLSRFWLGSVADQLVRKLAVPMLLVRPEESPPELGQEPRWQHILIPLDGSDTAEQILEPALALGRLLAARFTLVRVVPPLVNLDSAAAQSASGTSQPVLAQLQAVQDQQQAEARAYLERQAERLRSQSFQVQAQMLAESQVPAAILEAAAAQQADLIALETRGRRGLGRLLFGSVADKLVRGSTWPILVCGPRESGGSSH